MRPTIKYCLILSLPIVAVLGILYFRQSLIVLFQQIGWVSIVQFLESNALANILITALILVEVSLFFIGQHTEERLEKRTKLLKHYHDLKEKVLNYWLGSSVNITHRAEGFPKVEKPVYLATFSSIKGEDDWHKWLMQHIYDDEGYPSIRQIIEKLKVHEKKHNKFVDSLTRTLNDEIRLTLEDFPRLKEWKSEKREDYYWLRDICLAVLDDRPLKIIERDLYLNNHRRIANSDNDTLTKLKDRIEKIRLIHKKDLQNIQNGIKRDEELLKSIQERVKKILYELALEKPLKGKCDYERSLESTD